MADAWRSKRLTYRALNPDDDEFLSIMSSDPACMMNISSQLPVPQTTIQATKYREYVTKSSLLAVMICVTTADAAPSKSTARLTPIGTLSLGGVGPGLEHHRHAGSSITIIPAYQGQGYGTEAIQWLLHWGFRRANLHRIEIGAFEWNAGAVRLYQRMGFVLEARKREHFWHDGRYWDHIQMAMLEGEWKARYDKDGE